jgi:hypothetical protein
MPKMHSKVSLETKNQVLQEVPKTIFMTPICVCSTTNTKGLQLFFKSMELYLPRGTPIYLASPSKPYLTPSPYKWIPNTYGSFGEAYNACMREAFLDGHQEVIIANDDIVLDPDSYTKLLADRELLKAKGIKVGFLGARTNMSSLHMNVRNRLQDDQWNGMKWLSEEAMVQVQWIAPIFASVGIDGWPGFPPLNWYSDNVACHDMSQDGFVHFLSRSYVHHACSQTIGRSQEANTKNHLDAEPWLKNNRPDLHKLYFSVN